MKRRTALLAAVGVLVGAAVVCGTMAIAVPPSTSYNADSGEDSALWQSSSQAEIQEQIDKHIADPKAMYRLINESYGKKQEGYVASNLVSRLEKAPKDPKLVIVPNDPPLIIVTAYAMVQAVGDGSRGLWGTRTPQSMSLMSKRSFIFSLVTPDIWEGLDDPVLMIMAAAARSEKLNESVGDDMKPHKAEERLPVIDLCRRATLIDPKWADAHFWYGRMLLEYCYAFQPLQENKRLFLLTAKAELLKAAELDPGLKSDTYWQLTFVLESLGQPQQALSYFKKSIDSRRSGYGISPELIERTRKRLQEETRIQ